jgi:hypothetical protein
VAMACLAGVSATRQGFYDTRLLWALIQTIAYSILGGWPRVIVIIMLISIINK